MIFKKKFIIFPIIFLLIFIWGFYSNKNQIFPYKILKTIKSVITGKKTLEQLSEENKNKEWIKKLSDTYPTLVFNYQPGIYIFNDRKYINHLNDYRLTGLTVIQIPRHHNKIIKIEIFGKITVYRILCKKNNNDAYNDWQKADFKVNIIGYSCKHTDVVKKSFNKQIISLVPGGPLSADPIFIDEQFDYKKKFQLK